MLIPGPNATRTANIIAWHTHRGQNGFILHNLPSSFHIWSQIEAIICKTLILKITVNGYIDFGPLTILKTKQNRNLIVLEICPVSYRLWQYFFSVLYDKNGPNYGNFRIWSTFWTGDVIDES